MQRVVGCPAVLFNVKLAVKACPAPSACMRDGPRATCSMLTPLRGMRKSVAAAGAIVASGQAAQSSSSCQLGQVVRRSCQHSRLALHFHTLQYCGIGRGLPISNSQHPKSVLRACLRLPEGLPHQRKKASFVYHCVVLCTLRASNMVVYAAAADRLAVLAAHIDISASTTSGVSVRSQPAS